MAEDHTGELEKVGSFTSFHGDGRLRGTFDAWDFLGACDELAMELEKGPIVEVITRLLAPMGRTTVDQYTTGIPSLDPDDQYDTIRAQVRKWFDIVLPNSYLHFFWMGRFQALHLGLDYDLIALVRNEVFGLEPAVSLKNILGPEAFERLTRPLHDQTASFYRALKYHEQPWTNVPPGGEALIDGRAASVWDLYSRAFFGLVNSALPHHLLNHPKVYEATYYGQVPSNIIGGGRDG